MSAHKPEDAIAYLRLSRSYRRALLNTWLGIWQNRVHGVVLDIGGEKESEVSYPFSRAKGVRRWMYLNINAAATPDIVADAGHVPLATAAIDTVVCTETMEHVRDPVQVMRELSRVLCSGGVLLLSVPFLYRIHSQPDDFWRFTEYQVQRMLREAGFEIVQMERLGLFFTVVCDMIKQAISEIRWAALRWPLGLVFLPLAALLVGLERLGLGRDSPASSSFTTGYVALATKTEEP